MGYVLRNYNIFVYDEAWVKHVVGSAAVKGNAYYSTSQGATGSQYIPIPNFAPTYIGGKIEKIADYGDPDSTPDVVNSEKIEINVNTSDPHFPTYLGTVNKDIYKTGTEEHLLNGAYKREESTENTPIPYYYADNYILFDDFKNQSAPLIADGQIKGTYVVC